MMLMTIIMQFDAGTDPRLLLVLNAFLGKMCVSNTSR